MKLKETAHAIMNADTEYDAQMILKDAIEQSKKELIEKIEKLIVDETLICHKENTPTSRLTSLFMKLIKLKEKL